VENTDSQLSKLSFIGLYIHHVGGSTEMEMGPNAGTLSGPEVGYGLVVLQVQPLIRSWVLVVCSKQHTPG
jgi:hypothetical protein